MEKFTHSKIWKQNGIPLIEASHRSLGCPSYILVAVTTPLDFLIKSKVVLLSNSPKNSISSDLYLFDNLCNNSPSPMIFKDSLFKLDLVQL